MLHRAHASLSQSTSEVMLGHCVILTTLFLGKLPEKKITSTKCTFEPSRGKTNNVVSEKVRHKPACTATEAG